MGLSCPTGYLLTTDAVKIPRRHASVASRVYSGEAVLISPAENTVRMLNSTATRIWELADGSRTVDEIATALTREFDVSFEQAQVATGELLEMLTAKGLITWN